MKSFQLKSNQGFSLIEVVLVVSSLALLLLIGAPNLFSTLGGESVNTLADNITSVLKEAQSKTMNSETLGGGSTTEFGVHFEQNSFTLFQGNTYSSTSPNNFSNSLSGNLSLVPSLPCPSIPTDCNNVVFSRLTGEVLNFDATKNTVCLSDATGDKILISVNLEGVVNAQNGGC